MPLFWRLYLALLLADFVLQTRYMATHKTEVLPLLKHGFIYGLITVLFCAGLYTPALFLLIVILIFSHILIDFGKAMLATHFPAQNWLFYLADQLLHIAIIMLVTAWYYDNWMWQMYPLVGKMMYYLQPRWLSLILLNLVGGKYFVQHMSRLAQPTSNSINTRVSEWIGILERLLIMLAVQIGHYELIGYLFVAKSVVRFPEVRDGENFSNYYLIGSLSSFSWAIIWTLLWK